MLILILLILILIMAMSSLMIFVLSLVIVFIVFRLTAQPALVMICFPMPVIGPSLKLHQTSYQRPAILCEMAEEALPPVDAPGANEDVFDMGCLFSKVFSSAGSA